MPRRQHPREKKDRDLVEETRPLLEAPHAFRKNWPRRKARVNRHTRRAAKQVVDHAVQRDDAEDLTANAVKNLQKGRANRKHFVVSLGQRIAINKAARIRARGAKQNP